MSGLHAEGRRTAKPKSPAAKGESPVRLEERTREALFELARQLRIPGFADMTREELIEAIRRR